MTRAMEISFSVTAPSSYKGDAVENPFAPCRPPNGMRTVVAALVLLFLFALGGLELLAARGVPDANVPGAATPEILRNQESSPLFGSSQE